MDTEINQELQVTLTENTIIVKDLPLPDFTEKWDDTNIVQMNFIESELETRPEIDAQFVEDYFMLERLINKAKVQQDQMKKIIKRFAEENNTGSFDSNGMQVVYTNATTTTTIDSAKLKSKYPDIAAECSKTSPRASSISLREAK